MKSSAILFIALGFLLACAELFVRAQDANPPVPPTMEAPAVVAPTVVVEPVISSQSSEKLATAETAAVQSASSSTEPAAASAESAAVPNPGAEKPAAAEPATVTVQATEKTETAEDVAPAVVVSAATEDSGVEKKVAPAQTESDKQTPSDKTSQTKAESEVKAESVVKSEAQAPAAEKATTPAAEKSIEKGTDKSASETTSDFDLDRSAGVPAADEKTIAAKSEAKSQPKVSLWKRLFGNGKTAPSASVTTGAEAASNGTETSASAAGQTGKPGAPSDAVATNKMLTQEEAVAAQEEVRRQAKEVEALKSLDLAYQAMARNEFDVALKYFAQAMNVMPARPHTLETRQKAMQSQAECEYRIALNYYKAGKYQDAKDAIRRALGYAPSNQKCARLSEQIRKDEATRQEIAATPVPVRYSPEHLDRQKQIKELIDRGRQYYAIGEYDKALREFRNVLAIDEKNDEAAAHLEKLAKKMYNIETDQMKRQQAEMLSQVRDTWTPPVKRETTGPERKITDVAIADKGKRRLLEKLNGIVIPQLEFRQANIVDVIKYLDQASQACDKESAPGDKGINFILQLKHVGEASNASASTKPAEGELVTDETAAASPSGNLPPVTLSLRNIVLMDAIKYITEVTGLKYRIEESVVVITPGDVVYGELITRTYKVQPSIVDTLMGATGSAGGSSEGNKMELGGSAQTVERGDVRKFFVDAGVPFPEGTSIVYRQSLNLLIVKNTSENLDSFERILTSLNVVPVQVEIEARFVEVAQNDLEELGIEWLLTDNWELAENAGANSSIPLASRERVQMNENTLTKGLRNFAMGASGMTATPGGNYAGILSISSILTNPEMTMILHALEQKSGANLLSAPKVTTKNGANAEIKVVKELIYPTEFEVTQSTVSGSGSGSSAVITPAFVTPAAFQTRDTGVILNVTPTVGPDGFSIDLVMLPQVVELSEWINYGSTVTDANGNPQYMNMPQPIFHSRNITTSITIWDGQTVVMGGLITESQTTTEDKIPLLGDIPLIGYLFQSKTSISKKFNLLIFVTANLVDPAGNKINKELIATSAGTSDAPAAPKTSL